MNRVKRYQILCKLRDNNIHPVIELVYRSEFELLIAVLLSAQTSDVQVNKVTKSLFKVVNTPQDMLRLGVDGVKNYIKSIGLSNTKSKNIIKTCRLLIDKHNGILPSSRVGLESLPGVGRKTANIILNVVFGWPTIAVDTHVFRFCNRSCFASGNNVLSVEKKLLSVVPKEFQRNCHQWLVLHGRNICRAKQPNCRVCVIKDLCEFKEKK
ncbi:endonuclease III [Candidatus Blochmanniella camponoti]|uniref:Endonuclease III n=1 Tax=Candidatus Blochmanniella camponoti TaxID=108080 RepID=A0AAE9L6R1_9ENTR|nr:endonuclease III [Candidatus Blochmannia herculeanus]URJ24778.1 endonuclease III [Candidatus Blochmannia herculeanus]URJ27163.1 endonuclease III [Candidatus Blochmannia herculeanus]URJ27581.1 endonuclease III [Candidatus Blochmannia herculeanus]